MLRTGAVKEHFRAAVTGALSHSHKHPCHQQANDSNHGKYKLYCEGIGKHILQEFYRDKSCPRKFPKTA